MLRELSLTLLDLHSGLERIALDASAGVITIRLTGMELVLPVDMRMVFADGGCRLLTDVPRTRLGGTLAAAVSRLSVVWEQRPLDASTEVPV